jgi:membrane-associated protease RseP (regulator of RpoE activity)
LDRTNASLGLHLTRVSGASGRTDQASFYAKGIPNLHFFTGKHPDYHRPTDTFDGLNLAGMERVSQYVTELMVALAESEGRPQFVAVPRQHRAGASLPPFFGSITDFTCEESGCPVAGVIRGSPAQRSGVRPGDVIVGIGRSRIGNTDDLDDALRKYAAGDRVRVVVRRGQSAKTFEAKLDSAGE